MTSVGDLLILVDANVWVDNYVADHASSKAARAFLNEALIAGATLLYPVHAIKDVFYVIDHEFRRMARTAKGELLEQDAAAAHAAALGCIQNMCEIANAVGADQSDVWLAEKYHTLCSDFEDAFVLAACARAGVKYLVTSDKRLLALADVCAKTPRAMVQILRMR